MQRRAVDASCWCFSQMELDPEEDAAVLEWFYDHRALAENPKCVVGWRRLRQCFYFGVC